MSKMVILSAPIKSSILVIQFVLYVDRDFVHLAMNRYDVWVIKHFRQHPNVVTLTNVAMDRPVVRHRQHDALICQVDIDAIVLPVISHISVCVYSQTSYTYVCSL